MALTDLRREFLIILGHAYDNYGYPEYCGWIEGLLLLEQKDWSQRSISKRLREIFPASKFPTSVPSVNRALKILESYGVVERAGSRKTGFRYRLIPSSSVVLSMLQQLASTNQDFIDKLQALAAKKKTPDKELELAIAYQIRMAETWNEAMEALTASITKEEKDER
ncbi:MAG: hypothetical protein EAX95_16075 [Candidatus Thorarchaeota archaeon]|nr:hypothetical protein [Candidatus Thorarchaeota archaeon]